MFFLWRIFLRYLILTLTLGVPTFDFFERASTCFVLVMRFSSIDGPLSSPVLVYASTTCFLFKTRFLF